MTPAPLQPRVNLLDALFQQLSGVTFKANGVLTGRERAWCEFLKAGFDENDLREVLSWLRLRIKIGKRDIGCLRFSALIGCTDRFNEELGLARAERRNARPLVTPKEKALAQLRPGASNAREQMTAKPIGEWIKKLREAAR